ncbi:LysR family transcriptional regulator [Shewanella sp. SR44-3]|uniref:LysR family transcriptional regulator n=1 Tax=unclassified Shewanella TaxID=196818 RepID=UPI0015F84CF9|nr:LysR family transcriptional regulator [Shewanella sp. SR44-3]MBB1269950.1 LysR family transcriptional regulator [Shewanella sp. SR44-3]
MLNQQWLTTFIKLVELGHFTHTAEQLFMTQSGVSQQIKKLEQQAGAPLLNRIGKGFELTQAGIALLAHAKQLQQQQVELLASFHQDDAYRGECKLACSGSMAMLIYPHLIDYQLQHPQLNMSLEAAPNQRIIDRVLDNSIDVGIITQEFAHPELSLSLLGSQRLCLVLPEAWASQLPQVIEYHSLAELGMIDHPDGMHYWQHFVSCHFPQQLPKASTIKRLSYVNQLSQILMPVSKGLGFAVLPEFAVKQASSLKGLLIVAEARLSAQSASESLYLIQKRHRPLALRYQQIISLITGLIR